MIITNDILICLESDISNKPVKKQILYRMYPVLCIMLFISDVSIKFIAFKLQPQIYFFLTKFILKEHLLKFYQLGTPCMNDYVMCLGFFTLFGAVFRIRYTREWQVVFRKDVIFIPLNVALFPKTQRRRSFSLHMKMADLFSIRRILKGCCQITQSFLWQRIFRVCIFFSRISLC